MIRLVRWGEGDLPLLEQLFGDPAMMEHLGGPETAEKLAARQARYEAADPGLFKIVDEASGQGVGWVGYWERTWHDEPVWEVGWSVLAAFQGRGIASAATTEVIALARAEGRHRFVHAFPAVGNPASNRLCRKLGFTLLGASDFEFQPGHQLRCNDWRLEL